MTTFDPKLGMVVSGNEIVVVLPGLILFQEACSPGAKNIANKNDPRIPMTSAEFLSKA
jgi:hypothetical protein